MRITNTLSGQKEDFQPSGDVVRFYVCGMTPKFHPHVGHARIFVAADIMRRYLEYRGLHVRHVQNFTDIDDKIIARAADEGGSAAEVARKYTDSYFEAMDRLNVLRAHEYPSVTGVMAGHPWSRHNFTRCRIRLMSLLSAFCSSTSSNSPGLLFFFGAAMGRK